MIIDIFLSIGVLWLGFKIVTLRELFSVVVYFIVFGMMLGVVWARVGAFDLALAEVALGSGITGALLLDSIIFLRNKKGDI